MLGWGGGVRSAQETSSPLVSQDVSSNPKSDVLSVKEYLFLNICVFSQNPINYKHWLELITNKSHHLN